METNDGTFDYFEFDVLIEAFLEPDFKLGMGQDYFNYNEAAFGPNIFANGGIEVTHPNPDYIRGQYIDAVAANIYAPPIINDNITSRVSVAFIIQTFSSSTFAANNVTQTPTKAYHVKFKYIDNNEPHGVEFVSTNAELPGAVDQYFTACGSAGGGAFDGTDCTGFPGVNITGNVYDSAVLNIEDENQLNSFVSVYPNPIKATATSIHFKLPNNVEQLDITLYDITGKTIQQYANVAVQQGVNSINKPTVAKGLYFLKFSINNGEQQSIKKVVIE